MLGRHSRTLFAALFVLFLSGCSQGVKNILELGTEVFSEPESVLLTEQEISELNYAAAYFQLENQPRMMAPLAAIEHSQLKWRLSSNGFAFMDRGRLVSSANLAAFVLQTTHQHTDPLRCLAKDLYPQSTLCPNQWLRRIQFSGDSQAEPIAHYWVRSELVRDKEPKQINLLNGTSFEALHIIEKGQLLSVRNNNPTLEFENHFWQDSKTGRIVRSRQFISPAYGYIQYEEVVPYTGELSPQ